MSLPTVEQKGKIITLLRESKLGVISTISSSGDPESALVSVSETPDMDIILGSSEDTRKNQNIRKNPSVALVVGWDKAKTVQIQGKAEIASGKEKSALAEIHCKKHPGSSKHRDDPHQEYIKIRPEWIRYSDLSVNPREVWEVSFI